MNILGEISEREEDLKRWKQKLEEMEMEKKRLERQLGDLKGQLKCRELEQKKKKGDQRVFIQEVQAKI